MILIKNHLFFPFSEFFRVFFFIPSIVLNLFFPQLKEIFFLGFLIYWYCRWWSWLKTTYFSPFRSFSEVFFFFIPSIVLNLYFPQLKEISFLGFLIYWYCRLWSWLKTTYFSPFRSFSEFFFFIPSIVLNLYFRQFKEIFYLGFLIYWYCRWWSWLWAPLDWQNSQRLEFYILSSYFREHDKR